VPSIVTVANAQTDILFLYEWSCYNLQSH